MQRSGREQQAGIPSMEPHVVGSSGKVVFDST